MHACNISTIHSLSINYIKSPVEWMILESGKILVKCTLRFIHDTLKPVCDDPKRQHRPIGEHAARRTENLSEWAAARIRAV